jgi:hypothetical protein
MSWINFYDKQPEKFPCKGRNYDLRVEDIITGIDEDNKAFDHACFCKSLGSNISMPFTHWKDLDAP